MRIHVEVRRAAWSWSQARLWVGVAVVLGGLAAGITPVFGDYEMVPRQVGALMTTGPAQVVAAAFGDIDGDGRPDLAVAGTTGGVGLFQNVGGGGFSNITARLPGAESVYAMGVTWVDVDNDGDLDLFVTGWESGHVLYRNPGAGFWGAESGGSLGVATTRGMAAAWSDVNGDGWADFLMANGGGASADPAGAYLGSRSGRYSALPVDGVGQSAGYGVGAAWADADGDGLLDALIVNGWSGPSSFFRNIGGDRLSAVVPSPFRLAGETSGGAGGAWGDYDNDGDPDLYITGGGNGDRLYRNEGGGVFARVQGFSGEALSGATVGVVWADFDNDGWLDLMIANRTGRMHRLRNAGDGTFGVVPEAEMRVWPDVSNAFAVADYDGNGALDVVVGTWPSGRAELYENQGGAHGWLRVRLRGLASQRNGLGARVRVSSLAGGRSLTQTRTMGGEDGWGTLEPVVHFGLGTATLAGEVEVLWPSGSVSVLRDVAANQNLLIAETAGVWILPVAGVHSGPVRVSMRAPEIAGAGIVYTLDGSEPGIGSMVYEGAFDVVPPVRVRARQYLNGFPITEIAEVVYGRDPGVTLDPPGLLFTNRVDVGITTRIAGSELRYTTNGVDPVAGSALYLAPIRLTATTQVKARAYINGFPVSDVVVAEYRRLHVFLPDGIPGDWRTTHFGEAFLSDPRAAVDADPDGDGSSNLQEFLSGTDPLDARSGFSVGIRAVPEIRFHSVAGARYRILRRDRLGGAGVVVAEGLVGVGGPMRHVDSSIEAGAGFYVVETEE